MVPVKYIYLAYTVFMMSLIFNGVVVSNPHSGEEDKSHEKVGRIHELSSTSISWGTTALANESPPRKAIDNLKKRQMAFQGQLGNITNINNLNSSKRKCLRF